jgi:hypothetical protein
MAINSKGKVLNKMEVQVDQLLTEHSDPTHEDIQHINSNKEELSNLRLEIASYQR